MESQDRPGRTAPRASRRASEIEVEFVETIVTCSCSHTLVEHAAAGCNVPGCECELEREAIIVSEVVAIDES
jgi:hypothetical protein